jgi:hypothetical protein
MMLCDPNGFLLLYRPFNPRTKLNLWLYLDTVSMYVDISSQLANYMHFE